MNPRPKGTSSTAEKEASVQQNPKTRNLTAGSREARDGFRLFLLFIDTSNCSNSASPFASFIIPYEDIFFLIMPLFCLILTFTSRSACLYNIKEKACPPKDGLHKILKYCLAGSRERTMNIIMHLLFSYKMRKIIRSHSGVKLSLIGFMYGNILPDIKAIHKPHQINGSLSFLVKRTQSLIANPVQTVPPPYSWSRELGIITHYLSDYFCYAHQDRYDKGLGSHMLYELKMIAQYRRGLKRYQSEFSAAYHDLAPDHFEQWILEQNSRYNSQACSQSGDISYALYAGSMIGENMLLYCPVRMKFKKAHGSMSVSPRLRTNP